MTKRKTTTDIVKAKSSTQGRITCLTCYSSYMAKILDNMVDILLVGDSLGMVLYGYDSTLPVTLKQMSEHAKAVVSSSNASLVVVDMPFATYQESPQKAFKNAAKLIATSGATAVKLEGGTEMAETVKFLTERGVAVMGHIGLKPQSVNTHGGYKMQGKDELSHQRLIADALAIEAAGAFAIVLEMVESNLAQEITNSIKIPVIGIGAGKNTDGQVLVTEDMLGFFDKTPSFVKKQANLKQDIIKAVQNFVADTNS